VTIAQWISDGSEVPEGSVALKPPPARREWRFGRFELAQAPRAGRWSCAVQGEMTPGSDGRLTMTGRAVGIAGARTPLGALLAVLRMLRQHSCSSSAPLR
jgi:hypothetical protein